MEPLPFFASRLRMLREERDLNQKEAAELLGISRQSIAFYESLQRSPDIPILARMSEFFDVSADFLLGLSENRRPENWVDSKSLGLSDEAIATMKAAGNIGMPIVNALLGDKRFSRFIAYATFHILCSELSKRNETFPFSGERMYELYAQTLLSGIYTRRNSLLPYGGSIMKDTIDTICSDQSLYKAMEICSEPYWVRFSEKDEGPRHFALHDLGAFLDVGGIDSNGGKFLMQPGIEAMYDYLFKGKDSISESTKQDFVQLTTEEFRKFLESSLSESPTEDNDAMSRLEQDALDGYRQYLLACKDVIAKSPKRTIYSRELLMQHGSKEFQNQLLEMEKSILESPKEEN